MNIMFDFFRPILLAFLSSIFLYLLSSNASASEISKKSMLTSHSSYAPSQSESSSLKTHNSSNKLNSLEIALIASASTIALIVLLALILRFIYTRNYGSPRIQVLERREVTTFTNLGTLLAYHNIVKATEDFNAQNLIVSGEFSATYRAQLSQGVTVAVKRLQVGNVHSVQQFHAEIRILGGIRHPNLVTLIGYHASETEMFLIYDYLPGGSLEELIQAKYTRPLCWKVVYKVALDVAEVLVYLHDARIMHRDVKPSNVLLDTDLNGYLSGFGLSRLVDNEEVSENSDDVYGYGVVLLELISDKRALDGFNIVSWACLLLRQGKGNEVFSSGLWDSGPRDDLMEVLNMAVKCTLETLSYRPPMKDVVRQLKQLGQPVSGAFDGAY